MNLSPVSLLSEYLHLFQFNIHTAMMHHKLKRIAPQIKGRWLDIGAGDLPYKKYFASADEYLTTNTKRHYKTKEIEQLEKQTTYWIEDGKELPLPDNSLDGVACFQVLSVIDKPVDFFREMNRVLKPGGKLILTTDFIYPAWSKEDRYRHTAFSLKKLSESTGFRVEVIESFGGFGSTICALYMRYLRSFPEIWKMKNTIAKTLSAILYLLLLLFLPILSLASMLIFQIEKNSTKNTDFTFNLFLVATRKAPRLINESLD
ncbi:MAG: class I SAM-dependent methyltransferase [Lentimicrobiaceae bacterium]